MTTNSCNSSTQRALHTGQEEIVSLFNGLFQKDNSYHT